MAVQKEKPFRTEQEMFLLVESWLKSKLTQKEFSQQHKLPLHILPYWVGQYRKAHPTKTDSTSESAPTSFIELTPSTVDPANNSVTSPSEQAPSASKLDMEVVFPGGVRLCFSTLIPITYLKELLNICSR